MENWLLIIICVIFLVSMVIGCFRGFFKIAISLLSTAATVALIIILTPYVGQALIKHTPLDDVIEEKALQAFMPEFTHEQLANVDVSGTPLAALDEDQLAHIEDIDLERWGITMRDILRIIGEIPKDTQIKMVENSPIPRFLKMMLLENNNSEIYEELGVTTFPEYAAAFLARMVIYIVSFLVAFLLAIIIVKALIVAVDILGELPVVGVLNRMGGAVLSVGIALIVIWLAFLILTLIYSTVIGRAFFEQIEQSQFLTYLYENNMIMNKLLSF